MNYVETQEIYHATKNAEKNMQPQMVVRTSCALDIDTSLVPPQARHTFEKCPDDQKPRCGCQIQTVQLKPLIEQKMAELYT